MNDLISRSWLLDVVENLIQWDTEKDRNRAIHHVRELAPSAEPKKIRGSWVNYGEGEYCDQCGQYPYDDGEFHILGWRSNFCPHCGADMREDQNEIY